MTTHTRHARACVVVTHTHTHTLTQCLPPPSSTDDDPSPAPSAFATSTPPPPTPAPSARAAGYACIAAVATIWAGASFVVAAAEGQGLAPLALTYTANSTFILYLPLYAVVRARQDRM